MNHFLNLVRVAMSGAAVLCFSTAAATTSGTSSEKPPEKQSEKPSEKSAEKTTAAKVSEVVEDLIICKGPKVETAAGTASGTGENVGKAVRTLRVYKTKEVTSDGSTLDGCRATYSKSNAEQTVGQGRQSQQCKNIIQGIRKNLEASDWSCRTAQSASVLKSKAVLKAEAIVPTSSSVGSIPSALQ